MDPSELYTSTGRKFFLHREAMDSYRDGGGRSVVSTHISPEGACNLRCPYCSVTHRDTHNRIRMEVISDYVEKLCSRGLKAVILTGGGEPTIYREFDDLVYFLSVGMGMKVGLITNGTKADKVARETWPMLSWVRVSLNVFEGWDETISLPLDLLSDGTTVGASMVVTDRHEGGELDDERWVATLQAASRVADRLGAQYIRLLPDCLMEQGELSGGHVRLEEILSRLNDDRFFHQRKNHRAPSCGTCHQSYFRPYLSEARFLGSGEPGTVYPCDSLVLNDAVARFTDKHQLCAAGDVLDYLDGKIDQRFDPQEDCTGCVFTSTVEMLGAWKDGSIHRHGEFV